MASYSWSPFVTGDVLTSAKLNQWMSDTASRTQANTFESAAVFEDNVNVEGTFSVTGRSAFIAGTAADVNKIFGNDNQKGLAIVSTSPSTTNRPESYVTVLHAGEGGSTAFQLAAPFTDTERLMFRSYSNNSQAWKSWQNVELSDVASTISAVKTFSAFPVTPSSAPTTNYQVANKKYVDDHQTTDASQLTSGTLNIARIGDGSITNVKLASGIDASKLTAGTLPAARIGNGDISNAKLRSSSALSVMGRSANSSGSPADISAGTDGHVLRRSGTTLGFGTISTSGIADSAVTDAKVASGISASKLTTGTLPDARLSSNVVMTSGTQTIAGVKTFDDVIKPNSDIYRATATGGLALSGGNATNNGANLLIYGGSHNTLPNIGYLRTSSTIQLTWSTSGVKVHSSLALPYYS